MTATKETDRIRAKMEEIMCDDRTYTPGTPEALAEQCAEELTCDEWLDDPEHEVWELALGWFDLG